MAPGGGGMGMGGATGMAPGMGMAGGMGLPGGMPMALPPQGAGMPQLPQATGRKLLR